MRRQLVLIISVVLSLSACSTRQTTIWTRAYHSIASRYNGLYNAEQSYRLLRQIQISNNLPPKDSITLPLDIADTLLVSDYFAIIDKCERSILKHSLRRRPRGDKKTQHKEYNPSMYDIWLLLAKCQFYSASYSQAESTLSHALYLYSNEKYRQVELLFWQIRCLIALGRDSDAEVLLSVRDNQQLRGKGRELKLLYYYVMAELSVRKQDYWEAYRYMTLCIGLERRREVKSRLYWTLAQLPHIWQNKHQRLSLLKKAKRTTTNSKFRDIITEVILDKGKHVLHSLLKDEMAIDSPKDIDPFRVSLLSNNDTVSEQNYSIDWSRIYEIDSVSASKDRIQEPYLRLRVSKNTIALSELLFRLSSFHFKLFTQQNLHIQIESDTLGVYHSVLVKGFNSLQDPDIYAQYQYALRKVLADIPIELNFVH